MRCRCAHRSPVQSAIDIAHGTCCSAVFFLQPACRKRINSLNQAPHAMPHNSRCTRISCRNSDRGACGFDTTSAKVMARDHSTSVQHCSCRIDIAHAGTHARVNSGRRTQCAAAIGTDMLSVVNATRVGLHQLCMYVHV
eukprot:TRINITY_DN17493_c0_g1_i1.p1 TRINITY_DN17493_c0_g1~~TRINITY_DN17493_c0_g1_i1.p1  ORF type:complete len:139 (+),score=11.52 TRINITY_DN17493_c0_g1_i1:1037-1453(+)